MGLFKYREKRFGRTALVLFALLFVALAAGSVFGGVYAVMHMAHWSKYVICVVACLVGLLLGLFGILLLIISFSMISSWKSGRDGNKSKGVSNTRLCDKCGRVISKHAEFCEHCGEKQHSGLGMRTCPECKTKNSALAEFCEKCGHKFSDEE